MPEWADIDANAERIDARNVAARYLHELGEDIWLQHCGRQCVQRWRQYRPIRALRQTKQRSAMSPEEGCEKLRETGNGDLSFPCRGFVGRKERRFVRSSWCPRIAAVRGAGASCT